MIMFLFIVDFILKTGGYGGPQDSPESIPKVIFGWRDGIRGISVIAGVVPIDCVLLGREVIVPKR